MASENLQVDQNSKPVIGAVTDDANSFIKMARIDDTTKGLKVMVVNGTSGTFTSADGKTITVVGGIVTSIV